MLVSQSDSIWQGSSINSIMDKSGNISYEWTFFKDNTFKSNKLKVYFFNPNDDIVFIN